MNLLSRPENHESEPENPDLGFETLEASLEKLLDGGATHEGYSFNVRLEASNDEIGSDNLPGREDIHAGDLRILERGHVILIPRSVIHGVGLVNLSGDLVTQGPRFMSHEPGLWILEAGFQSLRGAPVNHFHAHLVAGAADVILEGGLENQGGPSRILEAPDVILIGGLTTLICPWPFRVVAKSLLLRGFGKSGAPHHFFRCGRV